jgi:ribonuclease BN (tRNA processing enzyme)
VGELILTHISQRYGDTRKLLAEAQEVFPRVKVAEDLEVFEVRYLEDETP